MERTLKQSNFPQISITERSDGMPPRGGAEDGSRLQPRLHRLTDTDDISDFISSLGSSQTREGSLSPVSDLDLDVDNEQFGAAPAVPARSPFRNSERTKNAGLDDIAHYPPMHITSQRNVPRLTREHPARRPEPLSSIPLPLRPRNFARPVHEQRKEDSQLGINVTQDLIGSNKQIRGKDVNVANRAQYDHDMHQISNQEATAFVSNTQPSHFRDPYQAPTSVPSTVWEPPDSVLTVDLSHDARVQRQLQEAGYSKVPESSDPVERTRDRIDRDFKARAARINAQLQEESDEIINDLDLSQGQRDERIAHLQRVAALRITEVVDQTGYEHIDSRTAIQIAIDTMHKPSSLVKSEAPQHDPRTESKASLVWKFLATMGRVILAVPTNPELKSYSRTHPPPDHILYPPTGQVAQSNVRPADEEIPSVSIILSPRQIEDPIPINHRHPAPKQVASTVPSTKGRASTPAPQPLRPWHKDSLQLPIRDRQGVVQPGKGVEYNKDGRLPSNRRDHPLPSLPKSEKASQRPSAVAHRPPPPPPQRSRPIAREPLPPPPPPPLPRPHGVYRPRPERRLHSERPLDRKDQAPSGRIQTPRGTQREIEKVSDSDASSQTGITNETAWPSLSEGDFQSRR